MEDEAGYESGAGSAAEEGPGPACSGEEAMDAEEREDDSPRTQLIKANIRVVGSGGGSWAEGSEARAWPPRRPAPGGMPLPPQAASTGHI